MAYVRHRVFCLAKAQESQVRKMGDRAWKPSRARPRGWSLRLRDLYAVHCGVMTGMGRHFGQWRVHWIRG